MAPLLPIGTIVTVTKFVTNQTELGKIVGYDLGHTKYKYYPQLYLNNTEKWANVDCWAFPTQVEEWEDPGISDMVDEYLPIDEGHIGYAELGETDIPPEPTQDPYEVYKWTVKTIR